MPTQSELNEQVGLLLTKWLQREEQQRNWMNGTVNGGPNGDGYYPLTDPTGFTVMQPCPAKMRLMAAVPEIVELTGAGPFTLTAAQSGNIIRISNGSSTSTIVVNVPKVVSGVWYVRQAGTSPLKFVPGSGVTLRNRQGHNGTAGAEASVALRHELVTALYLDGDTKAIA